MASDSKIQRFDFYERVVHWLAALSFVYAALTGLALWSPKIYWLASVFGGGETVRGWHPWGGVVFSVFLGLMFLRWAGQMQLDRDDRRWLRQSHRYAVNDEEGLPEADRFNAGQKTLFWIQVLSTVVLFLSGLVLWFPESTGQGLRLISIVVHSATAIISTGSIILHTYMGSAAVPGSFSGMIHGKVSDDWAASHHPKWHRRVSKR